MSKVGYCETCRYWSKISDRSGACRRRAPMPLVTGQADMDRDIPGWAGWPATVNNDWCGEYEVRVGREVTNARV